MFLFVMLVEKDLTVPLACDFRGKAITHCYL